MGVLGFQNIFIVPFCFVVLLPIHLPHILIVILRLRLRLYFIHWLFLQLKDFRSPRRQSWGLISVLRRSSAGRLPLTGGFNGGSMRLLRPHLYNLTSFSLHLTASPQEHRLHSNFRPQPLPPNTYLEMMGGEGKWYEGREVESKSGSLEDQENIKAKAHCWDITTRRTKCPSLSRTMKFPESNTFNANTRTVSGKPE
jgi:hypothetical protein